MVTGLSHTHEQKTSFERLFTVSNGQKVVESLRKKWYTLTVRDDLSRYNCVSFMRHISTAL